MDVIFYIVYFLSLLIHLVHGQDCRTYGQSCSDDYSCCGGCCLSGICRDTYLDCRRISAQDPCIDRYCPEDQVCVTSYPCTGCPVFTQCITMQIPDDLKGNKTLTHHHRLRTNSAHFLSPRWNYLVVLSHTLLYSVVM